MQQEGTLGILSKHRHELKDLGSSPLLFSVQQQEEKLNAKAISTSWLSLIAQLVFLSFCSFNTDWKNSSENVLIW
jgi:hypothetical protein